MSAVLDQAVCSAIVDGLASELAWNSLAALAATCRRLRDARVWDATETVACWTSLHRLASLLHWTSHSRDIFLGVGGPAALERQAFPHMSRFTSKELPGSLATAWARRALLERGGFASLPEASREHAARAISSMTWASCRWTRTYRREAGVYHEDAICTDHAADVYTAAASLAQGQGAELSAGARVLLALRVEIDFVRESSAHQEDSWESLRVGCSMEDDLATPGQEASIFKFQLVEGAKHSQSLQTDASLWTKLASLVFRSPAGVPAAASIPATAEFLLLALCTAASRWTLEARFGGSWFGQASRRLGPEVEQQDLFQALEHVFTKAAADILRTSGAHPWEGGREEEEAEGFSYDVL